MEKQIELSHSISQSPALLADGFDSCIIGFCELSERLIYSKEKMIELLMNRDGMSDEDAIDYLGFNIWNAYVGKHTPIYAWTDIRADEEEGYWSEEEMEDFRNQFPEPEILEYEDIYQTEEFKSLSFWSRIMIRLRVALAATFEMF